MSTPLTSEFHRPLSADQIGVHETVREIAANPSERDLLAKRFDLLSLDRLTAKLRLRRGHGGLIDVHGSFEAEVVQACVVTLDPVRQGLAEEFEISFRPAAGDVPAVTVDLDHDDSTEPMFDGRLDLGEIVTQQLAVALDPYPRSPSAPERLGGAAGEGAAVQAEGPFSVLRRWPGKRADR